MNTQKVVGAIPGGYINPFNGKKILGNNIYSDGTFEWGDDLIYLFKIYDIEIDKDFVDYVLTQKKHTNDR